uniref:Reverse transcriptase domain-containing protein n=1 Tax=Phytophthora ramorum TaxID=164328 RepID=H3GYE8_PHYRM
MSVGSPNTSATHVARADCPHLSEPEWEALQRLSAVIGEAAVATMLRTLSPTEQHGVALGFIVKEQRETAARTSVSPSATPRVESLKLHVDTAIAARRIVDPLSKVAFAMSCLGGRARSWAYGRRLTGPTCFSTYEEFKEELKQAFEPPQNEFLDLQQGKHDVHAYAQRARYLVSNIVTNPIDEATKVVTFMKGLRDGPVKTYLFREYPNTLEAAIALAMQEAFSLRQAKLHVNAPRLMPRPVARPSGGPEPMDLSRATAAGSQQRRGSTNVRCFRCGNIGHYARAGRPAGDAIERVDIGHAAMKIAAPSERQSHCKKQDDKPNLVILKEFVDELIVLELDELIVLELDDKFDMVLGMLCLARHDPVIDWMKRTIVRFGSSSSATESDGQHMHRVGLIQSDSRGSRSVRGDAVVSTDNVDTQFVERHSAVRRRGKEDASALGADAASSADGCKRPAPEMLASSRAAGLHDEAVRDQAGLERVRPRVKPAGEYKEQLSTAGPGQEETRGAGLRTRSERRKREKLRKSRSGTETLQAVSAGQTQELETTVETLSVLTRTSIGLQYKKMRLNNPPTLASELMSLPVTSWKRFARELHDGRIEQICILSDVERMTCEAEELNQLISEGADALSAKSKKQRFDEQGWDSLKASPFYKVLREYKDVLPDDIPAELPQDKSVQHEIDLVPGTKYCVTRQWPLPREQVKAIDDFFESRRNAGQVRESKSPHSAPTFCVKKPQGGWRIVHAYNKLNDATVLAQTPIPRKDVIIDSMTSSTIFSTLDLRDGFYQILMRESDIPLTAVSTPSGMLWEWLVMPQGLKNAPATFNRCVTHLLRSVRDFTPSYFDDVFIHSRAVNGKSDVEMHTEHLRKLLELMRKHKLYANLKKCIFGATEIPVLGCLVGKNGVRPDPGKVRVINEWPTPSNVKELRQFLGLATYLCKYVSNYAGKIRPLSQLLKKEAAWEWTANCQQTFEAVKQGLTEAPILAVADQDRPFHVVCDASDFAIGCALMQLDHEGRDHYNFQVEYKPGRLNVVADALSRRSDYAANEADANAVGVVRTTTPSSSLLDDVKAAYAHDADAKQLLEYFSTPSDKSRQKLAKHLRARVHRYRVHNGLLLYSAIDDNADRIVVPDDHELKLKITYEYHDAPTSGHPGREKTYLLLTRDFYWSHQYKWVRKYVRACEYQPR